MNLGKFGRGVAALTIVVALAAACTPDPGQTPSPTPTSPTTPAETELERQERLDYEAAEKSYRMFRAEYRRVLRKGGAKSATPVMKETAGGPYLAEFVKVIRAYRDIGAHEEGKEVIGYVRRSGYSPDEVVLDVCEDDRPIDVIQKNRKSLGAGEVRTARLTVGRAGRDWKVVEGEGSKVSACV